VTCRGLQELALSRGVMTRVFGLPVFRPTLAIPFLKYARLAFIASWLIIGLVLVAWLLETVGFLLCMPVFMLGFLWLVGEPLRRSVLSLINPLMRSWYKRKH
jgi:hypothetical protein